MEAGKVLRGDLCSRYVWEQLKFVEAAPPEGEGSPRTLHSHAGSPQPLRESSHDGLGRTEEGTEGLQREGWRWCAAELQEERILKAAAALKRVETLSSRLIREFQHCPTAVALGQWLVELPCVCLHWSPSTCSWFCPWKTLPQPALASRSFCSNFLA